MQSPVQPASPAIAGEAPQEKPGRLKTVLVLGAIALFGYYMVRPASPQEQSMSVTWDEQPATITCHMVNAGPSLTLMVNGQTFGLNGVAISEGYDPSGWAPERNTVMASGLKMCREIAGN